jgi:hypothetical protein
VTLTSEQPSVRTKVHRDLGLRRLVPQWKALLTKKDLGRDLLAGTTVAFVAVPPAAARVRSIDAKPPQ